MQDIGPNVASLFQRRAEAKLLGQQQRQRAGEASVAQRLGMTIPRPVGPERLFELSRISQDPNAAPLLDIIGTAMRQQPEPQMPEYKVIGDRLLEMPTQLGEAPKYVPGIGEPDVDAGWTKEDGKWVHPITGEYRWPWKHDSDFGMPTGMPAPSRDNTATNDRGYLVWALKEKDPRSKQLNGTRVYDQMMTMDDIQLSRGLGENWFNANRQYIDVKRNYENMLEVRNLRTGPGDLALIVSLAKLLDPGSVVREGEYKTAAEAAMGWLRSLWQKLEKETIGSAPFLSEDARKYILQVGQKLHDVADRRYTDELAWRKEQVSGWGLDPQTIFVDYREAYERKPIGGGALPPPGTPLSTEVKLMQMHTVDSILERVNKHILELPE